MQEFRRFRLKKKDIENLFRKAGYSNMQQFQVTVVGPPMDRMDNPMGYGPDSVILEVEWVDNDEENDR